LIIESTFDVLLNYFVSIKIFYKFLVISCFLFYNVISSISEKRIVHTSTLYHLSDSMFFIL